MPTSPAFPPPTFSEGRQYSNVRPTSKIGKRVLLSLFRELHCKTMSVLLLATIFLLCVTEVISKCPPDSGN